MEVFDARPGRKPLSADQIASFKRENQQRHQEQLTSLPLEQKEKVGTLISSFEEVLVQYLQTPGADPRLLDGLSGFIGQLGNALMYAGDIPSATGRRYDVEASLYGAGLVLDVSRETRTDSNDSQVRLAQRFLDLVNQRVARLTD